MHPSLRVTFGHFLMNDPGTGGHPLDVAGRDCPAVADAVAVLDGSSENIGDRLNAAMGMPWKARHVILRNVIAKIVKQEKWVKIGCVVKAERAAQVNPGTFNRRL